MSGPFNKTSHIKQGSHALKKKKKEKMKNVLGKSFGYQLYSFPQSYLVKYSLSSWDKIVYFRKLKKTLKNSVPGNCSTKLLVRGIQKSVNMKDSI